MSWVRASLFEAKAVFSLPPLAIMQLERQQLLGAAAADEGEKSCGNPSCFTPWCGKHSLKEEKLQVEVEDGLSYRVPPRTRSIRSPKQPEDKFRSAPTCSIFVQTLSLNLSSPGASLPSQGCPLVLGIHLPSVSTGH